MGVAYPLFMSFLQLAKKTELGQRQWLSYWVLFAIVQVIDQTITETKLNIKSYYALKLGFLIYLMHPSTFGATVICEMVVKPKPIRKAVDKTKKVPGKMVMKISELIKP